MLGKQMKAAILAVQHQPLVIDDVEIPQELSIGQVLVRVCYSSICGSQIGEIQGVKGADPYLPHLLGHEGSGVVEAIGPGVSLVAVGDHVVMAAKDGDGIRSNVPQYRWRGGGLNAGWVTTFNEYAVVSESRLTPIPKDVDLKIAPLLGCAILTGFGAVENTVQPKIGESVVVFGVGGVGLSVVQAAGLVSAHPIIAVDLSKSKLQLATRLGATLGVEATKQDPRDVIYEVLGDAGADHTIVCTENLEALETAYEVTKTNGQTIFLGLPSSKGHVSLPVLPLHYGRIVTGSLIGESQPSEAIPRYTRLIDAGELQLKEMITDTFSLEEINQAVDKMIQGTIDGRCLIEVNP
ncbi:zinc-binding dehydrogenase [Candidatus Poribacteria bacterium]|nr:zinc-binding dehydrogenase [Candidatus Poribacteria bacterium]